MKNEENKEQGSVQESHETVGVESEAVIEESVPEVGVEGGSEGAESVEPTIESAEA